MATIDITLAEILRDGRRFADSPRPAVDGLRTQIGDGLFSIFGTVVAHEPVVVRASSFRTDDVVSFTPYGRMRGALLTQTLRLRMVQHASHDPFGDAVTAWRASEGASELVDYFDAIDDDERARLATDVAAHSVVLQHRIGDIPPQWRPRTAVRARVRLANGQVELRDHVDLAIGSISAGTGNALIDMTSSLLDDNIERALRFHALVESLRAGVAPRFVAALSTATGDLWRVVVDDELLQRAITELLEVISQLKATP